MTDLSETSTHYQDGHYDGRNNWKACLPPLDAVSGAPRKARPTIRALRDYAAGYLVGGDERAAAHARLAEGPRT